MTPTTLNALSPDTLTILLEMIKAGSAGLVAVALILTVVVILSHTRKERASDRKTQAAEVEQDRLVHKEEVERLLAVHEKTCAQIAGTVRDVASAVRDLRDELLWERNKKSETEV